MVLKKKMPKTTKNCRLQKKSTKEAPRLVMQPLTTETPMYFMASCTRLSRKLLSSASM